MSDWRSYCCSSDLMSLIRRKGVEIDLATIPLSEQPTFDLLGRGDAVGVFQFEGSGMRDMLRNMKPDAFEDLIALVALYRPGPMENIPTYIARKHGREKPDRSEEHTSELQSLMRISYAVFCLKKKNKINNYYKDS